MARPIPNNHDNNITDSYNFEAKKYFFFWWSWRIVSEMDKDLDKKHAETKHRCSLVIIFIEFTSPRVIH